MFLTAHGPAHPGRRSRRITPGYPQRHRRCRRGSPASPGPARSCRREGRVLRAPPDSLRVELQYLYESPSLAWPVPLTPQLPCPINHGSGARRPRRSRALPERPGLQECAAARRCRGCRTEELPRPPPAFHMRSPCIVLHLHEYCLSLSIC